MSTSKNVISDLETPPIRIFVHFEEKKIRI